MSSATPHGNRLSISPEDGRKAQDAFRAAATEKGYDVVRCDYYGILEYMRRHDCPRADRLEANLKRDYSPTSMYLRTMPDFTLRHRIQGDRWFAEVKSESVQYRNLSIEALQLISLALLSQFLWIDIYYVYWADGQPPRREFAEEIVRSVKTVYANSHHESYDALLRDMHRCDYHWDIQPNVNLNDPFILVDADALSRWPIVPGFE